jgi:hypothetical protein
MTGQRGQAAREARLRAALRQNLKRRREQARQREAAAPAPDSAAPAPEALEAPEGEAARTPGDGHGTDDRDS